MLRGPKRSRYRRELSIKHVQRKSIKHQTQSILHLKEEHGNTSSGNDTGRGTSHLGHSLRIVSKRKGFVYTSELTALSEVVVAVAEASVPVASVAPSVAVEASVTVSLTDSDPDSVPVVTVVRVRMTLVPSVVKVVS